MICAIAATVCLADTNQSTKEHPTAMELLDKFTETVDKAHISFITKSKSKAFSNYNYHSEARDLAYMNGKHTRYFLNEFRSDGERFKQIQQGWGDMEGSGEFIFVPESQRYYASRTYDGKQKYIYSRNHDEPGRLKFSFKSLESCTLDMTMASKNQISQCFGYFTHDYVRFDRILRKAGRRRVTVREKMEQVNGTDCYVIDAKTNRGRYTIWLNPEKGYNYSKATVVRQTGDLYQLRFKLGKNSRIKYCFENTNISQIDGVWVPVKAKATSDISFPNSDSSAVVDLELTSILIDPDHDALDSFSVDDIRENAWAGFYSKIPGMSAVPVAGPDYRWAKNPKFVSDRLGRRVRYEPDKGMLPVVKRIPNPRVYNRELSFDKMKDKKVLLCFCKLSQTSSQEYVLKLTEQADSLAQKGVVVILVQTPEIKRQRLNTWMKKNEVLFPVGKISRKTAKEILRSWGTDKLPHLVLADKNHTVIFEGFSLEELNEKIKEINDVAN